MRIAFCVLGTSIRSGPRQIQHSPPVTRPKRRIMVIAHHNRDGRAWTCWRHGCMKVRRSPPDLSRVVISHLLPQQAKSQPHGGNRHGQHQEPDSNTRTTHHGCSRMGEDARPESERRRRTERMPRFHPARDHTKIVKRMTSAWRIVDWRELGCATTCFAAFVPKPRRASTPQLPRIIQRIAPRLDPRCPFTPNLPTAQVQSQMQSQTPADSRVRPSIQAACTWPKGARSEAQRDGRYADLSELLRKFL
jgi:hypothetical protein